MWLAEISQQPISQTTWLKYPPIEPLYNKEEREGGIMQAIDIANAQHTLSIVHEFLGFRKASKKEKEDCLKKRKKRRNLYVATTVQ